MRIVLIAVLVVAAFGCATSPSHVDRNAGARANDIAPKPYATRYMRSLSRLDPGWKPELGDKLWPPTLPDVDPARITGMWLYPNGGNERYLMVWLRPDGVAVGAAVLDPRGDPDHIRLENGSHVRGPWELVQDGEHPFALLIGEIVRYGDGSSGGNRTAYQIHAVYEHAIQVSGLGWSPMMGWHRPSVWQRVSGETMERIAALCDAALDAGGDSRAAR